MRQIRISILILAYLFFKGDSINAQLVKDKIYALNEIVKLSETYSRTPNLSFSLDYTYADSTTPTSYIENVSGQTKISSGKSWTLLDSVEMIQGNEYNLSLYYRDSSLIVSDRKGFEQVLQVSFLDSLFRSSNVDSVELVPLTVGDTLRTLNVFFKPESNYSKYVLVYNKDKYRIQQVKYYIKDATGTLSGTAVIQLDISNYDSATPIDQTIFNEWSYIYRSDGNLYTNSAYSYYTLYNYSLN